MDIIFEKTKKTGIIKLNRPEALNALNYDMAKKFSYQLNEWEKNDSIEQILLLGEGKHFCAGGDVKSLSLGGKNTNLKRDFFFSEYKLNYQINNFSKPYLSLWNGVVMGGGIGLSLYGNFRIVTDTTKFAMPETAIGFFPDVGGSYFLSKIKNNYGIFLALTGNVIGPLEILNLGLGTHYCPSKETDNFIDMYIESGILKEFNASSLKKENELIDKISISKLFDGEIKTIFKKLKEHDSNNAEILLNILEKKCPMSLAVTLELLKKGKSKNLKECLEMEYKLSQNMVNRDDFDEGIDAVLVSKHHNPNWNPSSINDIEQNHVNKLFEFNSKTLKL